MQKVSVIIPIYNVEKYLEKCLDSVVNQTYKNLEIICVDDCSPDNSASILQKYALKDSRIIIVNREKNGGLSAARNTGLDNAIGEYIYFIDSDDWIDLDYIEKMVEAIKFSNTDFVVNLNAISVKNDIPEKNLYSDDYIKFSKKGFLNAKEFADKDPWAVWINLYKRDFIEKNKLRFYEGSVNEDVYFHYISYLKTSNIFVFKGPYYNYNIREGSITTDKKSDNIKALGISEYIYTKLSNLEDFKKNNLKLFIPIFNIEDNEENYILLKQFLEKIKVDVMNNPGIYTDFELFKINMFLKTNNFEEYKNKYNHKDSRIFYLRSKHKKEL